LDILYILICVSNNFIAKNDYKLINFTKNDTKIVKRIKDYAKCNCREQINTSYITSTIQNFDYGILLEIKLFRVRSEKFYKVINQQ